MSIKCESEGTASISLWGGRFNGMPSQALNELSRSTHFDWRLADYDLRGSLAHAKALHAAGLLNDEEIVAMVEALEALREEVAKGSFTFNADDEDVHTALERGLMEKAGDLGGKLRAGRSRNDQIATLIRLYLRDASQHLSRLLLALSQALLDQAKAAGTRAMAGRTHMQHAQPVLIAHHLSAHIWPLLRDVQRFENWINLAQSSPYGAGALAGNTLGLDPQIVAQELGFQEVCPNSIDATAARDLVSEFAWICAQIGVDLSRLSEEIIIWNTAEFGYVKLDDSYSTGSSIMPQKKNPDVAELARGKAGRLIGNLMSLLTMLKGIPLAYDRDLQEDKEPVFDTIDTLEVLLPAVTGMIATMKLDYDRMESFADAGYSLATDIAEWLVKAGMPFRQAHEASGKCVAVAEAKGIELKELSDNDFFEISPMLTPKVRAVLNVAGAVSARNGTGGTAPEQVNKQLLLIQDKINSFISELVQE